MFNKFNQQLADKFNRKKTIQNDIMRFQNIHKKINHFVPVLKQESPSSEMHEKIGDTQKLYQFNEIKTSVYIDLNITRENDCLKNIPKIQFKEVPIPHYSDNDKFNRTKTIQNDIMRFQNIHKKINHFVPVLKQQTPSYEIPAKIGDKQNIYEFNESKTSVYIDLNITRENDCLKNIPKIQFKEVPIPHYSDNDKFDLNKINQNISTPIHMDIFVSDIINDGDINPLKKKKINKIIHIYQEKYADNVFPTGFGDFIRSCFFIIQFCNKYEFKYEIIINHPIAELLKNYSSNHKNNSFYNKILHNKVCMFTDTNWAESVFDNEGKNYIERFLLIKQKFNLFVNYLCRLPVINGSIISYNILFPYDPISIEETNLVRSFFEPSREMELYIDETLDKLFLVKKKFIVLHIRSGDSYLINKNMIFDAVYLETIKNEVIEIIFKEKLSFIQNKGTDILLIADNNEIKILLKEKFPIFKFIVNDITHIGEGVQLESVKIKDTLLDFYLMSNASSIYSFTSYPHGSGFSYWCSKIYNIPYKCKYIKFNL